MERKSLLFIMDTFPLGGIAKSLLALINELDDEKYEIDLLLMKKEGFLLPLLPEKVTVLDSPIGEEYRNPHPKMLFKNLKELSFRRWCCWLGYSISCTWGRLTGGLYKQVQNMDVYIAKRAESPKKEYDAAIAYQGGRCIYYLAEKVNAKKKIGYVHSDYLNNETDYMLKKTDDLYFPKMDYMVTISDRCLKSLKEGFPLIENKCVYIENICSEKMIRNMANNTETFTDTWDGLRFVTMGRIEIKTKGIDFILDACNSLLNMGLKFRWYYIGDGAERIKLDDLIANRNLKDTFILLGAKLNPYPFIKACDIYVQPSRIEGKSVALDEVKALHKPIVVTNFSTVHDQFTDGKTALIAEMSGESVANRIIELINNDQLRVSLVHNLECEKVGNEEQVKLFEALL